MNEFEKWFSEQDMPIDISLCRIDAGFILKREMTPILKEGSLFAWNHQQSRINKMQEIINKYKIFREATAIKHKWEDPDLFNNFENKIKQLEKELEGLR